MSDVKGGARTRLISWIAGGAALALVATIAVIASGFDARETPREEPSVWAMRASGQYARVNTLTDEIDTVRRVEDPSGLVQLGPLGVLLSHGNGRAWNIDAALPLDLSDEAATAELADATEVSDSAAPAADDSAAMRTPAGTRDVAAAGDAVVFRTEAGEVYLSATDDSGNAPKLSEPQLLDPLADGVDGADESVEDGGEDEPTRYQADAVAIDGDGRVAVFSEQEGAVRWYDVRRGEFVGEASAVPEGVPGATVQLAIVAGEWVLLDTEAGELWREGAGDPVPIDLAGDPKLQASSTVSAGTDVLVADTDGLWQIEGGGAGAEAQRIEEYAGSPAQPMQVGDDRFAAWLGASDGRLWSSQGGATSLGIDQSVEVPGDAELVIRTSGSSAVLSEVQTGMLWTLPDGTMIPVEQWTLNDPPKEREGVVVVNDVTEQEPPVATDDAFGVRQGEPALLPVLLNDFDPNRRDVLTIVPEGMGEGLPDDFGEVAMLADGQSLVVQPRDDASDTASFTYRVTDGHLTSEPATVSLKVVDEDVNTAPGWCAVEGCQREWPSPEVVPGGTLVLPILEGWVDAEGDPMVLLQATPVDADDPIRALVTDDGRLAMRHEDPNAPDSDVAVKVEVADSRGATTERELRVQIRSNAKAEMPPMAASAQVGVTTNLRPLTRIVGGSGSFSLVDASVVSGDAKVAVNAGAGLLEVTAGEPGMTTVTLTARDNVTESEITGALRITATDTNNPLGLPPLRAFVRPLSDSTVDVLDAIPGANSRALVVRSAEVVDGELRADVIEHANVRVSGSTPDGAPGRIGAVDVTVAEEADTSVGRLTVFQVPESGATGAIAVADSVTVRAGAVADIRVLDNDVAPPGQRLVLHPEVSGSGTKGELAFASGSTLRYLAPGEPGNYILSYTTYSASSPESSDVGQVHVTVLPRDGNRDPQPRTLTARVAPGERVSVTVPLSGVDPDGDRVRLIDVTDSDDPTVTATVAPRTATVQVEAARSAGNGTRMLSYGVRDDFGGTAEGRLRVIVTDADESGNAPITYSDYVRLAQGAAEAAAITPTDNDLDPSGGTLELIEVVPNVPGGSDSREYRDLAARLDTSQLRQGRVLVSSSDQPGTASYRYTVQSSESKSTADGLIVVQVSGRVGQQAPSVQDTVLTVGDRAALEGSGVDVLTNRVTWASGDVSTLKMSLWGRAADRYTASGSSISGTYRAEGDLVPFKLAGVDHSGEEVETFGFLVIPSLDELRLTLRPGLSPISVDEGDSVDVALADVIDLAPSDRAEFKTGALPTQRDQASCEATSATTIRYSAGRGGPWADSCVVSVKLTEQSAWTRLALPVSIVPDEPVAELQPLTRTVAPGASETINLLDMVSWQGGREGNGGSLRFTVSGGGGSFETQSAGSSATVTARADAVPGSQDVLTVTVSGAGDAQSKLTLRVGQAAKDSPRGGSISLSCRVGSSCQAQAIGAPGEYDPFAGQSGGGLTLESVSAGSCPVATFQVSGDAVSVGWPDGSGGPGGQCTATYTVRDAQKRVGQGTIELDAQGVPRAPTNVTPVSAGRDSVRLSVSLSGERSHPAVSGVELLANGRAVGRCSMSGGQAECTVSGLTPGERRTYTARAVNSVGSSEPSSNGAETWAYRPPAPPSLEAPTAVDWVDNRDSGKGKVRIVVGQSSAASRILTINGAETPITSNSVYEVAAGNVAVSVMAVDEASMLPPGYSGGDGGKGDVRTASGTAHGAPRAPANATLTLTGDDRTAWSISTSGFSGTGDQLTYHYNVHGQVGNTTSTPITGSGLPKHKTVSGSVWAGNRYGRTGEVPTNEATTGNKLPTLTGTYTVNSAPSRIDNWSITYRANDPSYTPSPEGIVSFSGVSPGSPNGTVHQCAEGDINCSDSGSVTPASLEPLTLRLDSCVPWDGTSLPSHTTIADHFATPLGVPGGSYTFTAHADRSITVGWDGLRGQGTFIAGLCEATPPEPDPDPGDEDDEEP